MANLLLIAILCSGFDLKWTINEGTGSGDRLFVGDTDRDSCYEVIFTSYSYSHMIHIYELHLPDTWVADSFLYSITSSVEGIGDFDTDGLYDLLVSICVSCPPLVCVIAVFESPDSFFYPTQEVWRDTIGITLGTPYSVYDVDGDGHEEILATYAEDGYSSDNFWIYENTGNNQYELIYKFRPDTTFHDYPHSTHAFGDFDGDGKVEFIMGGAAHPARYWIYESPSNNSYEKIIEDSLPTSNIKDCFSVFDADGDGKMEFVLKGFIYLAGVDAFIFEATANNTYEVIKEFHFSNTYQEYYAGHSEAADVDGDSVPEIVLEACQDIYIIKSAGNDSFYVWDVLPGNLTGSNVRIFDLDNNGLNEIIISGNNQTRIYEYVPGNIEETAQHLAPNTLRLQVYPNPASNNDVRIRYTIPNRSKVGLIIYNSLGQAVDVLVDRELEAGVYELYWNRKLSAGVYFVKFTTNTVVTTNKLILLK
jgi:hypothetical protein